MKKNYSFLVFLLLSFLVFIFVKANAQQHKNVKSCDFVDHVYITAPAGITITYIKPNPEEYVIDQITSTWVDIYGTDQCDDISVPITVSSEDGKHYVDITMVDGPYRWNPTFTPTSNQGLNYLNVSHQTGTFDYNLNFSN